MDFSVSEFPVICIQNLKRTSCSSSVEMMPSEAPPNIDLVANLERASALWDALREEHFETVEQLPLTLYRQLALLKELDQQADTFRADIVPTLHSYLFRRAKLHTRSSTQVRVCDHTTSNLAQGSRPTGDILRQLAHLSENLLRISEEKVNLALAAHDSVERHIRLLDQAIHEQQLILFSTTNGTLATPIILPDLSVPRWARSSRNALHSSEDESSPEVGFGPERSARDTATSGTSDVYKISALGRTPKKLEAIQPRNALSTKDTDSKERRYCYCNRVSFGQMIACDDQRCQREWFHLECTGLTVPPKGEWYCRDCSGPTTRKRKRK